MKYDLVGLKVDTIHLHGDYGNLKTFNLLATTFPLCSRPRISVDHMVGSDSIEKRGDTPNMVRVSFEKPSIVAAESRKIQ